MRVASMELAAYLVISADIGSHAQDGLTAPNERRVELLHDLAGLLAIGPYDNPVGFHEVIDGGAFFQEFRIADYIEGMVGEPGHGFTDKLVGSYGHCALGDDHSVAVHVLGDVTGYSQLRI